MIRPELLAPAGTYDCFVAAVNAGADAVYLAGERFGARAYAGNFTDEEILLAIRHAHLLNVKIYLTVNTLIKESEIDELTDFLAPFVKAGLDGVIVQDLGAAKLIRDTFPKLTLCGSTQMTITGYKGAKLLETFGFDRVIPARELSLQEIRSLCENINMEVEVFIHGAMCYCYSGQCLFSSMLGDRSANRGRCAGPCRMEYSYKGSKKRYMLSLKDMMSIDYIPDLIRAGVASFKIEGRMKPAEYVAGIVSVYRKYIDRFLDNLDGKYFVEDNDRKLLNSVYIRSMPKAGYLEGMKGGSMISLDSPAYTPSDEHILKHIREDIISKPKKLGIDITVDMEVDKPVILSMGCGNTYVYIQGDIVEEAKNAPLSAEKIEKAISKLGSTQFISNHININANGNVFMPVSALNELRRQGVEALERELLHKYQEH